MCNQLHSYFKHNDIRHVINFIAVHNVDFLHPFPQSHGDIHMDHMIYGKKDNKNNRCHTFINWQQVYWQPALLASRQHCLYH